MLVVHAEGVAVAAEQHDAQHAQVHGRTVGCRQPGHCLSRPEANRGNYCRPGHEHAKRHLEPVPPAVAADAHPHDHRPGHEQAHADLLHGRGDEAFQWHVDQHARIHCERHLAEMEGEAAGTEGASEQPRRRARRRALRGEGVQHAASVPGRPSPALTRQADRRSTWRSTCCGFSIFVSPHQVDRGPTKGG